MVPPFPVDVSDNDNDNGRDGHIRYRLSDLSKGREMLDEQQVRQLWDMKLGAPMSDEDFENRKALALGPDDEAELRFGSPEQALQELSRLEATLAAMAGAQARERSVDTAPPSRWAPFQAEHFRALFDADVLHVRALFGLSEPLGPENVPAALYAAESDQEWPAAPCEVVRLWFYDSRQFPRPGTVLVYRSEPVSSAGPPKWPTLAEIEEQGRRNRLAELYGLAERMGLLTGIGVSAAVYYVLCGGDPAVPWLSAFARPGWNAGERAWLELRIGSLEARPEEVAALYKRARAEVLEQDAERPAGPIFRRVPPGAEELVAFCEKRLRDGEAWDEIARAWTVENPSRPYNSGDTLGRVYRRYVGKAPKRARGEKR
jgi:hypothetical protein